MKPVSGALATEALPEFAGRRCTPLIAAKGRPFIQAFAYAQVLRGGELNFSFADLAPSPVVYKTRRTPTWTWSLEWYAEWIQRSDLDQFDYAFVSADEGTHRFFTTHFGAAPPWPTRDAGGCIGLRPS